MARGSVPCLPPRGTGASKSRFPPPRQAWGLGGAGSRAHQHPLQLWTTPSTFPDSGGFADAAGSSGKVAVLSAHMPPASSHRVRSARFLSFGRALTTTTAKHGGDGLSQTSPTAANIDPPVYPPGEQSRGGSQAARPWRWNRGGLAVRPPSPASCPGGTFQTLCVPTWDSVRGVLLPLTTWGDCPRGGKCFGSAGGQGSEFGGTEHRTEARFTEKEPSNGSGAPGVWLNPHNIRWGTHGSRRGRAASGPPLWRTRECRPVVTRNGPRCHALTDAPERLRLGSGAGVAVNLSRGS